MSLGIGTRVNDGPTEDKEVRHSILKMKGITSTFSKFSEDEMIH